MPETGRAGSESGNTSMTFIVDALDTLFFRDGRPFDQTDEGLAAARSMFPPSPRAMAMGLRAAIARAGGWIDWRMWEDSDDQMPGNGDDQGGYAYHGPVLCKVSPEDKIETLLLPTPAHLGLSEDETRLVAARPAEDSIQTSLGNGLSRLTPVSDEILKHAPVFLHGDRVRTTLSGAPEIEVNLRNNINAFSTDQLFQRETSVGLARSYVRRSAIKGMLYQSSHIRPRMCGSRRIALLASAGHQSNSICTQSISRFGGEGRSAAIIPASELDFMKMLGEECTAPDTGEYLVMLVTPGRLDLRSKNNKLPGTCVGAALPRQLGIGGWSGPSGSRTHQMMMPPGTVLFMRSDKDVPQNELEQARRSGLADTDNRALGYGEFIYGKWPAPVRRGAQYDT